MEIFVVDTYKESYDDVYEETYMEGFEYEPDEVFEEPEMDEDEYIEYVFSRYVEIYNTYGEQF